MQKEADKIFQSTCIFDSVSEEAYPGYVAIKGKQILEVGCGDIPNELVGESTEVVDYGEGTICPGFGDTHTFFTGYVVDYLGVDLSEAVNLKQIVERLSENLEMNPETVVLFGNHLQPELAEKINKGGELEQVKRPVILFTAGHGYCAMNKVAEEVFGFTPDTCGSSEAIYKIMKIYLNDRDFIIPQFKAYMSMLNPKYVSRDEVSADYIAHEKEILLAQIMNDPKESQKPEKVIHGMIEGRISKELKEICLVDQVYVKAEDGKQTVGKYLEQVSKEVGAPVSVKKFVRFETGEGLEKKNEDFAAEVAAQIAGN